MNKRSEIKHRFKFENKKHAQSAWMALINSELSGCLVLNHADTDAVWTVLRRSRLVQEHASSVPNVGNPS